ncbi:energy-coupling factor ABC transporter ATP-binding protein [Pseudalkalibacillus decolorationis]|uniref:energy-coupling factor ABC transporter ATP-binding protein n=1 Tax=Pseudalkalibacillus decolorationis TaxID=163879 RepID=UPI0021496621|nr:energy-coupling factor ABC transporter ATP-binding protein [Pseudalkalibacillus decolorationis]
MLIELKNVFHQYADGNLALKDISVTIREGKKIAILGNNGAGKSTLLFHLNGLLKPTTGQLFIDNKPLNYRKKTLMDLRKRVGLVFQDPESQVFSPTVFEDVAYGPRNLGLSPNDVQRVVDETLTWLGIDNIKDKPTHFLSVGQKKRVAIAGALVMEPQLLVMDEPTAGLDPFYVKTIRQILGDIHQKGTTILLSTHDINFAYEWADEIIIMNGGELLCHTTPYEAFQDKNLLNKCNLEQPWMIELYHSICKPRGIEIPPKTTDELQKMIEGLTMNSYLNIDS